MRTHKTAKTHIVLDDCLEKQQILATMFRVEEVAKLPEQVRRVHDVLEAVERRAGALARRVR